MLWIRIATKGGFQVFGRPTHPLHPYKSAFFIHLPKTGGITVETLLRDALTNELLCPHYEEHEFLSAKDVDRYKVFIGHNSYYVSRIFPEPIFVFTILREPMVRLVSLYNFIRRRPQHPEHEFMLNKVPTLEAFATHPKLAHIRDGQTKQIGLAADFLSIRRDVCNGALTKEQAVNRFAVLRAKEVTPEIFDLAARRLKQMEFVGITERLDETCHILFRLLNIPGIDAVPKLNAAPADNPTSLRGLSSQDLTALQEATAHDRKLYALAQERFERISRFGVGLLKAANYVRRYSRVFRRGIRATHAPAQSIDDVPEIKRQTPSAEEARIDRVRAKIASVPKWHHAMTLAPGVKTPGVYEPAGILKRMNLPEDLDGLRVLDIGARDGFSEVIAVDYCPSDKMGFDVAREILGAKTRFIHQNIYNLPDLSLGRFDIVFFMGLIYHLPDPYLALEIVRSLAKTGGTVFLESAIIDNGFRTVTGEEHEVPDNFKDFPIALFTRLNPTQHWLFTALALRRLSEDVSFSVHREEHWGYRILLELEAVDNRPALQAMTLARGKSPNAL
jgi:tRNA (mo5U34)-methyltransferase